MKSTQKSISSFKSISQYISELWSHRELLWILAKRDVIVKYKQTVLGVAWSAIRPLITTLVMAFAFGKIGKLGLDTPIAFVLMVLPGVLIWLFFSQALVSISQSLINNANLITKVYFPRLIIPLSTLLLVLVDVLVALGIFVLLCFYYGFSPNLKVFFVPFILVLCFFAVLGIGLIAAVLNVKFRDIGQIVPFIVQFGYFVSPVGYLSENVKNMSANTWTYKIFCLNPVTGLIDLMRWAMLGKHVSFNCNSFYPLVVFTVVSLWLALIYFRKHENDFVDYI
jgi:lipopolysaccharide transport system permease protein